MSGTVRTRPNAWLVLALLGAGVLASIAVSGSSPYKADSANYIEQARSLIDGRGFQSRGHDMGDVSAAWTPDPMFPPGYPLLVAVTSAVSGIAAEIVAPWLNRLSVLSLPLSIFLLARRSTGDAPAAVVAVLAAFSPGPFYWGRYALTDVLSLELVVLTLLATQAAFLAPKGGKGLWIGVGGGLLAGLAYLVRNANVALLLSAFVSSSLLLALSRDRAWHGKVIGSWFGGAALVVLPWFLRNLAVFGSIQPYMLPHSTLPASVNLQAFVSALFFELTGSPVAGALAGWTLPGAASVVAATLLGLGLVVRHWHRFTPCARAALVFSGVYASVGMAVVVAARTRYQWGESISVRHTMAYAPFILAAVAIVSSRIGGHARYWTLGIAAAFALLAVPRAALIVESIRARGGEQAMEPAAILDELRTLSAAGLAPCGPPADAVLLSNHAYLYRIVCDAGARYVGPGGMGDLDVMGIVARASSTPGRVFVALHPGMGLERSSFPFPQQTTDALVSAGWKVTENSPISLRIVHEGTEPAK